MKIESCHLCPRNCGVARSETEGRGVCGMGALPLIARAAPHFGEEPCFTGTRGSGAVFFCGCCMGCIFCQNSDISRRDSQGRRVTPQELAEIFLSLQESGVHNLNLVTATHFAPAVVQALEMARPSIPIIWNCSGYESLQTLEMLRDVVDIFLPDYKYADSDVAAFCSHAPDYPEKALEAIVRMREMTGPAVYDGEGMMLRGTLVRHLVLPGLTGMSLRALTRLRDALPEDVPLSLMGQYTPCGELPPSLNRTLPQKNYKTVEAHAHALGFPGYRQLPGAQGREMIPLWDGTGTRPR